MTMTPDILIPEIRRYLLGQLDQEAAAALESRYFADPVLADDVREAELDLVDEYLAGGMPPADRERFDTYYLASPVHRARVATARALAPKLAAPPATVVDLAEARARTAAAPAFYGWLALAAALVIASLWSLTRPVQGPAQARNRPAPASAPAPAPAPAPAVPETPGAGQPAPAPVPAPAPPTVRSVLAFTLSPIVTRGESPEPQRLPAGPADLLIRLEGPAGAADRAYLAAEIETVDGRSVWQGRAAAGPAGSGILATVRVPAERLAADDYVVVLTATTPEGREERGRYVLRLRAR